MEKSMGNKKFLVKNISTPICSRMGTSAGLCDYNTTKLRKIFVTRTTMLYLGN